MDADKVTDVSEIADAAATRIQKIEAEDAAAKKAAPAPGPDDTSGDAPDSTPEPPADDGDGAPAPDSTSGSPDGIDVDGERLTAADIRALRSRARQAAELERNNRAMQQVLADRDADVEPQRRAEQPKADAQPAGPDPIDNPDGWKYARYNQYVEALAAQGRNASPDRIIAQVEQDHVHARTDRMHQVILEERAAREREREETQRSQQQWRQDQEANQIAKTLRPLFAKYPQAATAEGQRDVEAHIIRAVHLGETVDYEKIVARVHNASRAAVKSYVGQKTALAAGTRPAAGRGGAAQGTKPKLRDSMPADVSSIMEYAERAGRGEV